MKKAFLFLTVLSLMLTFVFSSCGAFEEKYTVTFDCNGGTLDTESSVTVAPNSTVVLPLPHKDDCTFIGWYLGEGANEEKFGAKDTVTSDITLKAKWINDSDITNGGIKIDIHTVTFNADGGSFEGDETINAQTYSTIRLPSPEKEGHVFLGWVIGEGANEAPFTAASLVTDDITLTAKWAKAEYTVSFIDYYGNVIKRETVMHGESAIAPSVPRINEKNLRFDAWDTDLSSITSDAEVKALYVVDAYTITYVTGTSQTVPQTTYFFGETPILPPEPAMSGHYFIGWYLDEEFTEEYLFDSPLTSDITLYAYFNESIPIATLDELLSIPEYSADNYFLLNDIDCEGAVINTQVVGFSGMLDGCGHTVYNFVYQPKSASEVGLFKTNGGTIKDLNFSEFSYSLFIDSVNSSIGFVVGINYGLIENVHISEASLSYANNNCSTFFGATAGVNGGEVRDCSITDSHIYLEPRSASWSSSGTLIGFIHAGALVGRNDGTVRDSYAKTVSNFYLQNTCSNTYRSGNETYLHVGGLVSTNNGSIKNCDAAIEISGSTNNYRYHDMRIGGLVRLNNSEIEGCSAELKQHCWATLGYRNAGGFVSENYGTIRNCHAKADVSSTTANALYGGFVAANYAGIDHCYATGDMDVGAATLGKGSFAGYNNGNINACFADVNITATDATLYNQFIGSYGTASYTTNCYYSIKAKLTVNGQPLVTDVQDAEPADPVLQFSSSDFLKNTLGWSDEAWCFDENDMTYPTLK